jgi:hypothetical protein
MGEINANKYELLIGASGSVGEGYYSIFLFYSKIFLSEYNNTVDLSFFLRYRYRYQSLASFF